MDDLTELTNEELMDRIKDVWAGDGNDNKEQEELERRVNESWETKMEKRIEALKQPKLCCYRCEKTIDKSPAELCVRFTFKDDVVLLLPAGAFSLVFCSPGCADFHIHEHMEITPVENN